MEYIFAQDLGLLKVTYSAWSSCKYFAFLKQDLFCVVIIVDDDDFMRAHHE